MTTMINVIGLAILVNLWTHWFTPVQGLKYKVLDKLPSWMIYLNCSKCMGLWVGILVFQNIYLGALASLTSYLIENLIYFIDNKREL